MKRTLSLILSVFMLLSFASCKKEEEVKKEPVVPTVMEMQSICELSTLDCYYHNVAKYEKDVPSFIPYFKKHKRFWMEYSGNIKVGIDASQLQMDIDGEKITVTIPEAKVLSCNVDDSSLTPDSFIDDKNAAAHTVEDEQEAFREAQRKIIEDAEKDKKLLSQARERAMTLIGEYIENICEAAGSSYEIKWVLKNDDGSETKIEAPEEKEEISENSSETEEKTEK